MKYTSRLQWRKFKMPTLYQFKPMIGLTFYAFLMLLRYVKRDGPVKGLNSIRSTSKYHCKRFDVSFEKRIRTIYTWTNVNFFIR